MCRNVNYFNDPPYEVDVTNSRIGYRNIDSINYNHYCGYKTAFAYLYEIENVKFKGLSTNASLRKNMNLHLLINCGSISYANIEPSIILGVSGTLKSLSLKEQAKGLEL